MSTVLQLLGLANPQASRLFIDLIRDVTSKWANWDPGHSIKAGDFGVLNVKTGCLEVKGNIYDPKTNSEIFKGDDSRIRDVVEKNPVVSGSREENFYAISMNGRKSEVEAGPNASVAGLADAGIKGRWKFNSKRGALLIMSQPQSSYIPPNTFLEDLAKVAALKDMYLVTQVFSCPAFSLYLSNKKNDDVSIALLGSAPVPHAPCLSVGGGVKVQWWSSTTAGLIRNGLEPGGQDRYSPLYTLQKIRVKARSRRGLPDPVYTGDDLWASVEPPWQPLDDNGNELSESDGDSDDDDED